MADHVEWVTWIDGAGDEHPMDYTTGCIPLIGRRGRWLPPVELASDPTLGADGSVVRSVRYGSREVFLPVGFVGASPAGLWGVLHNWQRWLDPSKGQGRLVVEYGYLVGGGSVTEGPRALDCYYVGGLEGSETEEEVTPSRALAGLLFRASDPLWQSASPSVRTFPLLGDDTDFTTGQEQDLYNYGTAATWPLWTITTTSHGITGPIMFGNIDTGKTITYNGNLGTSTVLEIDTRPGSRACRTRPSGGSTWTNRWGLLDPSTEFWPLAPASNLVGVFLTGWTAPKDFTFTATVTYRYLGL